LILEGRRFGSGPSLVVLAHMRPADMESWFDFARVLAAEGYSTLAFNFRGYGDSEGDGFDVDTDVLAAIDFADGLGAEEAFVIGASMGGTGSVTASSQRPVSGTITLSAPGAFEGADAVTAAPALTAPILLVAAENDTPYPSDAGAIDAATTVPSEVVILPGSQHGTNLFLDHGEELTALILEFLAGTG
jgi:pimeloyl-ACP methyl ester carboxylesterase